jgi:predicted amidophosphoribosyltransferase
MRERHFPRSCRSCEAPMARREEACWRCGAPCVDRNRTLLYPGSVSGERAGAPERLISTPRTGDAAVLIRA